MNRKILFGIWSLPIAKIIEPTMQKLNSMGYDCTVFVLQSQAWDFLHGLDYNVIDVSAGKTKRSRRELKKSFDYETNVNRIVEGYGRKPEWNIEEVGHSVDIASGELERLDPGEIAGVVLWGGRLAFQQEMKRYAEKHDVPVILLERGHFPSTIIVDEFELDENTEFRTLIWPFLAENDDRAIQQKGEQIQREFVSARNTLENQADKRVDRGDLCRLMNIRTDSKIVFLPLQVPIDTNIIFRTFDIQGNEDLVETVKKAVDGYDNVELLVKFHPGDKWTDRDRFFASHKGIRIVDGVHVHDVIRHADLVITINSQVCIESILFNKPVITCGRSHFGGLANFYHVKTRPALVSAVRNSLSSPKITAPKKRNAFVYGLREVYLVDNPEKCAKRIDNKITKHDFHREHVEADKGISNLQIGIATSLLGAEDNPTFWLRIESTRRALEKYGSVNYITPENINSRNWDIVYVAHRYNELLIKSNLHRIGCLVFDINDSLFNNPLHGKSTRELAGMSDIVVFSSEYLKQRFGHLAKRAFVLADGYELPPTSISKVVRQPNSVVWTGYRNNLKYVDEISEGLAVAQQELGINLILVTSRHNDHAQDNRKLANSIPGLDFDFYEWQRDNYYETLARADIAIAPLSISEFCMAKTANKLLTYQAAGLCVVAQAGIPSYEAHIRHGENGLLAFTPQDFYDAIKYLHENQEEKERMRVNGQASLAAFSENALQETVSGIVRQAYDISATRQYMRDRNSSLRFLLP